MAQFKNFKGKRYFKSLQSLTKSGALQRAKQYRQRGMLARIAPDGRGYYDVWTASPKGAS